jgi:hypothetical protein
MNVTRFDEAPEYLAPHPYQTRCVRLQGHKAGSAERATIEPGGHTSLAASRLDKHYIAR